MKAYHLIGSRKILFGLIFLVLLTPLVFDQELLRPLQTTKFLYFTFFVELAFLLFISMFQIEKVVSRLKHPVFLFFTVYVFWVLLSSFLGVDFLNSFFGNAIRTGGWFLLFHIWLFVALLVLFLDRDKLEKVEYVFVIVATFVAAYGVFERFGIVPTFQSSHFPRVSSLIGNPIYLAGFLILPMTLALVRVAELRGNLVSRPPSSLPTQTPLCLPPWQGWRIRGRGGISLKGGSYVLALAFMLGTILATQTRGVFLGLLVGVFAGWLVWMWRSTHRTRNIAITIGGFLIAISLFVGFRVTSHAGTQVYRYTHFADASVSNRLGYWKIAMQGFRDRPLVGFGYENFYRPAETYFTPNLYEEEGVFIDKPHNTFLEILVTSGLIGLLLFLCVLFFVCREIFRMHIPKLQGAILFGGFIAYNIQNAFVFDTIVPMFAFAFFLAWVISVAHGFSRGSELATITPRLKPWTTIISVIAFSFMLYYFFIPTYRYFVIMNDVQEADTAEKSWEALQRSKTLLFVYDRYALAKRYELSAQRMFGLDSFDEKIFSQFVVEGAEQYARSVKEHPLRGEYWFRYASIGLLSDVAYKSVSHNEVTRAIDRSIELASVRVEPYIARANQLNLEGRPREALEQVLLPIYQRIPESPKLIWTIAGMYYALGEIDQAADFGYRALRKGVHVSAARNLLWVGDYYAQKNDFEKVVHVYEDAVGIEPENVTLLPNLVAAYVSVRNIEKAIETAQKIIEKDPEHAEDARRFIAQMKSTQK